MVHLLDGGAEATLLSRQVAREPCRHAQHRPHLGHREGGPDAVAGGVCQQQERALGFAVGVVICYQILYTDVLDHLAEFATLKAMGYGDGYIRIVVIIEAWALSVLGFLPSVFVGASLQPLLAAVSQDSSLSSMAEMLQEGIAQARSHPEVAVDLSMIFDSLSRAVQAVIAGNPRPISWTEMILRSSLPGDTARRVVVLQPVFEPSHRVNKISAELDRVEPSVRAP